MRKDIQRLAFAACHSGGYFFCECWSMRCLWIKTLEDTSKIAVVTCILAMTAAQQGCLAAAWVAAVGADSMRAGDVRFEPFEGSWVSNEPAAAIVNRPSFRSVALIPVDGDDAMADRLAKLLQRETALQVLTPATRVPPVALADEDRAAMARELSSELAVDAVLYGRVVGTAPHPADWGWKHEQPRRLFLYMIDRHGHLLWKDELPFLVVTGAKPALEDSVQLSLTRHFMDHVHELGLDEAGYLPAKSL